MRQESGDHPDGRSAIIISMLTPTEKIWHNGRFIRWEDATIHVLSHVVSYGSSVFEGIRCYSTPAGPAIFRLREHVRRMLDSAKIYRMENLGFTADATGRSHAGAGARQQDGRLLHPPHCVARLRRNGRQRPEESDRGLPGLLGVGQVPGRRGAGRGRGRVRFQLEPPGAQHPAGAGQGRRQLHELAAHQDGSHGQRLHRRHRARCRRLRQRRLRREHFRGARRQDLTRRRWALPCCPASPATPC